MLILIIEIFLYQRKTLFDLPILLSKEEANSFTYKYVKAEKKLKVYNDITKFHSEEYYGYLCIFRDKDNKPHFIYIFGYDSLFDTDYIYGLDNEVCLGEDGRLVIDLNLPDMRGPLNFDIIYVQYKQEDVELNKKIIFLLINCIL